ncbi:MAG: YiiX/YebB-like N1pC/P60 family cysteine hydrolase [Chloroflexota bacterium]
MIHTTQINGLTVQTGDIICTMNGKPDILPGEFWRLVGRLVPGDVDHVAMYLGPNGRCAESGARGVVTFNVHGDWESEHMMAQRGHLVDTFYGVAYPLAGRGISPELEEQIREDIAAYSLAHVGKPYNLNFLNAETEESFYCSQLVYKAYQRVGINLNTGLAMEGLPGTNLIVYPQEIWEGNIHRMAAGNPPSGTSQLSVTIK